VLCETIEVEIKTREAAFYGPPFFVPAFWIDQVMSNKSIKIKDNKLRGEWAELCFMARAAEHGLRVSKPFGDCASYDVSVECGGTFHRVQIKSTGSLRKSTEVQRRRSDSYLCGIDRSDGKAYTKDQVDFLAVYIIPCDVWYIFPVEALGGARGLTLCPQLASSKHAPYKEAWHLLTGGTASQPSAAQQQEEDSPDDEPMNPVEARFRAIQWNPILPPHWKPRR
jgi:hypothetical protein